MLITIDPNYPKKRLILQVVETLRGGGIIVYPTDTTYGIGCDLYNRRAIERVYKIKRKDRKKPLSFICADLKDLSRYAQVDTWAYKYMRKLLPGPYTFILQASKQVPKILMTNRKTVGIRVPDNYICREILQELTTPIISTSVRLGEGEIYTDPQLIEDQLGGQLDLVIDGGILVSEPSTVVELIDPPPRILREGKGDTSYFLA
ncbi:threonylcarbamoyl-AMP synthase [bacterium]|nr:threonylcarbamoyl-AMP synthase [candidate division CSSED10-310 bacterium]